MFWGNFSHLSSTSSAMLVVPVVLWHRVVVVVVDVGGGEGVIVGLQVRVIGLDAVVEDGDNGALPRDPPTPRRLHVHVEAAPRAVVQVPLRVEHGIAAASGIEDVLPLRNRVREAFLLPLLLVEDRIPKRTLKIGYHFAEKTEDTNRKFVEA